MPFTQSAYSKRNIFISLVLIFLIVGLAFSPCLRAGFVNWDDDVHLFENPHTKSLSFHNIKNIFTSKVNNVYIPLTTLSFSVENHFFGYDPFFYHLNNLILHLLIVALIFFLCMRFGLTLITSGIAALLFGIHPMHVESVAWVTERKDVLYAFFYMIALYQYWRYLQTQKNTQYALSILFGFLSMLAKPMALSLPLVFLLCDWFYGRKISLRVFVEKIPYMLFIVPVGWITYSHYARIPGDNVITAPLIWIWSFVFYLIKFVNPYPLVPIYELPYPVSLQNAAFNIPVVIAILLIIALIRYRKNKFFVFAIAFYFLSIFFLLRFDDAVDKNIVADRFMYLPSVGFCILIGILAHRFIIFCKERCKKIYAFAFYFCIAIIFTVLSFQTFLQCSLWRDSIPLWTHQLTHFPETSIALNNLATAYTKTEGYKKAVEKLKEKKADSKPETAHYELNDFQDKDGVVAQVIQMYQTAIKRNESFTSAYYNLGSIVYKDLDNYNEAIEYFRKALELDPTYKDVHYKLGCLYIDAERPSIATVAFESMIKSDPDSEDVYLSIVDTYSKAIDRQELESIKQAYVEARLKVIKLYEDLIKSRRASAQSYFNLGFLYSEIEDTQSAIIAYEHSLEIDPRYVDALYNLGNAYRKIGDVKKAINLYTKAISVNPTHEDAYLNLGIAHGLIKDYESAVSQYKSLIALNPKHTSAYFNLGYMYTLMGQNADAIESYKNAIAIDPAHSESYYNLGNIYIVLGMQQKAKELYNKAIAFDEGHMNATVNLSIIYYKERDYKKALEYCRIAQGLGYVPPEDYLNVLESKTSQNY